MVTTVPNTSLRQGWNDFTASEPFAYDRWGKAGNVRIEDPTTGQYRALQPGEEVPEGANFSIYTSQEGTLSGAPGPSSGGQETVTGQDLVWQNHQIAMDLAEAQDRMRGLDQQDQQIQQQHAQFQANLDQQRDMARMEAEQNAAQIGVQAARQQLQAKLAELDNEARAAELNFNQRLSQVQEARAAERLNLDRSTERANQLLQSEQLNADQRNNLAQLQQNALGMLADRSGPQDWTRYQYLQDQMFSPDPSATTEVNPFKMLQDFYQPYEPDLQGLQEGDAYNPDLGGLVQEYQPGSASGQWQGTLQDAVGRAQGAGSLLGDAPQVQAPTSTRMGGDDPYEQTTRGPAPVGGQPGGQPSGGGYPQPEPIGPPSGVDRPRPGPAPGTKLPPVVGGGQGPNYPDPLSPGGAQGIGGVSGYNPPGQPAPTVNGQPLYETGQGSATTGSSAGGLVGNARPTSVSSGSSDGKYAGADINFGPGQYNTPGASPIGGQKPGDSISYGGDAVGGQVPGQTIPYGDDTKSFGSENPFASAPTGSNTGGNWVPAMGGQPPRDSGQNQPTEAPWWGKKVKGMPGFTYENTGGNLLEGQGAIVGDRPDGKRTGYEEAVINTPQGARVLNRHQTRGLLDGQGMRKMNTGGLLQSQDVGGANPDSFTFNQYSDEDLYNQPFLQQVRGERQGSGFGAFGGGNRVGPFDLPTTPSMGTLGSLSPSALKMTQGAYEDPRTGQHWQDVLDRAKRASIGTSSQGGMSAFAGYR